MSKFTKNHIPHNKGKHMSEYMSKESINKIKKTQFKPGENIGDNHPSWKGGVQHVCNDCVYLYAGVNKRIRRPKFIWEQHNNCQLPNNMVIYHKDGNACNDHPDNLEAITRSELLKRNNPKMK